MRRNMWLTILLVMGLAAVFAVASISVAETVPRMTKEELKGMLGSSDLVLVDVRRGKDWDASEFKIKGAVRKDPNGLDKWKGELSKEKTIVLYCA